ncbi:MAG: endonuclease domain-containing protein [Balneola sp.]|nr:MAG: endonuclease domain-containing protein [Balneola sp.]
MTRKPDIIPYKKGLVKKARHLRKNSTPGEIELWVGLKGKQILGFDFDRQKPIHTYIVDFFCKELRLAIEIDGDSHSFKIEYDNKREQVLNDLGVNILRFSETDAKNSTDHCLLEIQNWIKRNPPLSPPMEGNSYTIKGTTKRFY